jgi:hypothetical protein
MQDSFHYEGRKKKLHLDEMLRSIRLKHNGFG